MADQELAALLAGIAGFIAGRAAARKPKKYKAKERIRFRLISIDGNTIKGDIMSFILKADQKVTVSIQPVDKFGNPASVDGAPVWVDATGQTSVVASDDGLSAVITPNGAVGTTQINVSADADMGDGVVTIAGVLDLEVVAGDAVALVINPGTPEAA